jgi:hypothetical protein
LGVPSDSESNGHVSGDHTDKQNGDIDDAEQRLLDADDEVVDTDEQVEDAAIERLLGVLAVSEEAPRTVGDETSEQRRLQTRQRYVSIVKYTAVNLGREVSDPNHIGTYDVEARRLIGVFKHDWCETVAERVSQASNLNIQSWPRLKQLDVDGVWQIVAKRWLTR